MRLFRILGSAARYSLVNEVVFDKLLLSAGHIRRLQANVKFGAVNRTDVQLFFLQSVAKIFCMAGGASGFSKYLGEKNFSSARNFHGQLDGTQLNKENRWKILIYQQMWRLIHQMHAARSCSENFITDDEVKTAGEVAQDIIACYNGATAEIETMQQPLSFEKVRQVFDPFWQKVKQETHIPIHILWQLVSFTAATDGAYVRQQVSLFGREASVRGHSHGGGGGDGGIADVYLKNGKPCKQYFLLAMYSLFSSAKVTVACGAQSAAGEGATVFGLLHELRKETPLATGIPSSKIFLSVVADHAPVLHRLILSFGGNYYSHAEHAITCEPSEQTQIKARFDRKTMKLEIVSTVSRDSSSSLSSSSLRMKYPIHPEPATLAK